MEDKMAQDINSNMCLKRQYKTQKQEQIKQEPQNITDCTIIHNAFKTTEYDKANDVIKKVFKSGCQL